VIYLIWQSFASVVYLRSYRLKYTYPGIDIMIVKLSLVMLISDWDFGGDIKSAYCTGETPLVYRYYQYANGFKGMQAS